MNKKKMNTLIENFRIHLNFQNLKLDHLNTMAVFFCVFLVIINEILSFK
jgi:hypothetical protein